VDLAHRDGADPWTTHRSVLADAVALQALVDDLLLLARRDSGNEPRRATVIDLDDLALSEAGARAGDRVPIDVSRVSAGQVLGDATELRLVVRNLLDNSLRHARTRVSVELSEDGDTTVFAVADDGPGIAPADRERVFGRFTRLDDARTAGSGGTGLGLAITREIVEAHGGRVIVDPHHEAGTRMEVRLPCPR
jgi:signal transduction histidine kinase